MKRDFIVYRDENLDILRHHNLDGDVVFAFVDRASGHIVIALNEKTFTLTFVAILADMLYSASRR